MIKFKLTFIITLALLIAACYFYGKEIVNSLLLVFLSMFFISLISLLFLKRYTKFYLNLENKKVYIDENLKVYLHIHNRSLFLYPYINFSCDFLNTKENLNESFSLLPFKKLKVELNFKLTNRGIYDFKNYFLEVQDIFLISSKKINCNDKLTITVYPKNIQLPLEIQKIIDSVSNSSRNNMTLNTPDTYSSIDKYALGDTFKNIHWKISAKRNSLYVKKFDSIKKQEIKIYMDMTNCLLLPGTFHNITDENLVSFSLSIIKYLLRKGETIYLDIENLKSSIFHLQSVDDYYSILYYYLKHNSMGNGSFFSKVLEKTLQNAENYKLTFIITYTVLPKDIEILRKISANYETLIIFTLLDVDYRTKNLLSNINVNVVAVSI